MKRHLHIRLIFNVPPPSFFVKKIMNSALGTHWITNNYFLFLEKQKKKQQKYISTSKFHRFWASLLERDGRKKYTLFTTPSSSLHDYYDDIIIITTTYLNKVNQILDNIFLGLQLKSTLFRWSKLFAIASQLCTFSPKIY